MLTRYLLERKRANPGTTLLVHSGDMVGASPPESGLLQDEPTIRVLNQIGFDVGTPGNHEFDEGLDELLRLLNGGPSQFPVGSTFEGQDFPLVSANIVDADTKEPIFDPYLIKRTSRACRWPSSAPPPSPPRPSSSRARSTASSSWTRPRPSTATCPSSSAKGVEAMVLLIHEGGTQDRFPFGTISPRIADVTRALDPEVDVVMAGHSHTALNSRVDGRLVVQASSFGWRSRTSASPSTAGPGTSRTPRPPSRGLELQPARHRRPGPRGGRGPGHPGDRRRRRRAGGAAGQRGHQRGREDLLAGRDGGANAAGESPLGNLIADAQRAEMDTQFAFMNPGGIRARIQAGEVTWGELFAVQPFANDLVKMDLTGRRSGPCSASSSRRRRTGSWRSGPPLPVPPTSPTTG